MSCQSCIHFYDDSDGHYYLNNWYPRCRLDYRMENLKGFPFETKPKCHEDYEDVETTMEEPCN